MRTPGKIVFTIALIAAGLFVLLLAALVYRLSRGPIVFSTTSTSSFTVLAVRDESASSLRCMLRLSGQDAPYALTEMQVSRELAQALGASPPNGFVEEPLVAGPKVGDEAFVQKFNAETVRWVGQIELPTEQNVVLNIPVQRPQAGRGTIRFRYERRGALGGSMRFFVLTLESP
jgi:hypothetical protein